MRASVDPEDIAITLRSRCRHVALVTPPVEAIAQVLMDSDGLPAEEAHWAASVSGGHVGRPAGWLPTRRLESGGSGARPGARRGDAVAGLRGRRGAGGSSRGGGVGADGRRNDAEAEELRTALGAGGTGKGTAGTLRGATGAIKDLERRQKSRQTRASRDALDRALIDLATYFRDALLVAAQAGEIQPNHPDMADRVAAMAAVVPPDRLLRCIEAVLECREALAVNVKPKFAVDAIVATVGRALRN